MPVNVFWKDFLIGVLIVALGMSIFCMGWVKRGEHDAGAAQATILRDDKAAAKIEQKIMTLPDPELNKRLKKWMRD